MEHHSENSERCSAYRLSHGMSAMPPPNEDDGDAGTWTNWAKTQSCRPAEEPHPNSKEALIAIVNEAREKGKKVRCAGSGHSWSSSSVTDGVLVIVDKMNKIYPPAKRTYPPENESWTVEVETGVTIKQLDKFLRTHNPPLAVPSNTVLESVRYGGVLSLGCVR